MAGHTKLTTNMLPPTSLAGGVFTLDSPGLPVSMVTIDDMLNILSGGIFAERLVLEEGVGESRIGPILNLPFLGQGLDDSVV